MKVCVKVSSAKSRIFHKNVCYTDFELYHWFDPKEMNHQPWKQLKKNLLFSQKYLTFFLYVFLHLSNSKKKVGRTDWYFPFVFSSTPNTRWEAPWGTFSVCRFLFYFRFLWFLDRIADYVQNSKKSTIFLKAIGWKFPVL